MRPGTGGQPARQGETRSRSRRAWQSRTPWRDRCSTLLGESSATRADEESAEVIFAERSSRPDTDPFAANPLPPQSPSDRQSRDHRDRRRLALVFRFSPGVYVRGRHVKAFLGQLKTLLVIGVRNLWPWTVTAAPGCISTVGRQRIDPPGIPTIQERRRIRQRQRDQLRCCWTAPRRRRA